MPIAADAIVSRPLGMTLWLYPDVFQLRHLLATVPNNSSRVRELVGAPSWAIPRLLQSEFGCTNLCLLLSRVMFFEGRTFVNALPSVRLTSC